MAQTRTLKAHSCMINVTTMSATNEISDSGTLHAVHVAPQVPARTCVLVQFQSNLRDTTQMSPCSHSGWLRYALICSAKVQLLYRQFARSSPHGVTRDCVFGHRHDSSNGEHHSVMQSVFVFGPMVSTLFLAVTVREHYTYTADWHITQRRKIHDRHTQLAVASKNIRTRRKKTDVGDGSVGADPTDQAKIIISACKAKLICIRLPKSHSIPTAAESHKVPPTWLDQQRTARTAASNKVW